MQTQMELSKETVDLIVRLANAVKDETKPFTERQQALRLICDLRGESYIDVPEVDLRGTGSALAVWYGLGVGCSVNCALECAASVRVTREREQGREQ